jgi:adenylate cyclase
VKNRSLLIQKPDGSTQVVAIDKPLLRIGRAEDNDITLVDAERSVSRWHASISVEPDGSIGLSDLKSANGTTLNGSSVRGHARLTPNDVITIGSFRITFQEESQDLPFVIRSGEIGLQDLQRDPQLLSLFGGSRLQPALEVRGLELLYEVGMTLARSQSIDEVSAAAVELVFKIEEVHRASVMLWNEGTSSFQHAAVHFRGGGADETGAVAYDPRALVLSRTILNRVRQENRPLLIRDANAEALLNSAASIVRAGIQAAFCSPLSSQGRFLGVLYADNLAEPDAFSDLDFRVLTAIAAQTGLALGNAIASKELLRREVQRQALKAYLPPQVAELILSSDGAIDLSGTLQEITVMFADIRGFTRISESMDAREVVQMLNELFTAMSEVIFSAGGTVDKFIGDCIMALFGAPLASPLSADRALAAAVQMQDVAQRINASRAALGLREMPIGIGLHTGPAVVGNIGSSERVQYTAIGDTVNVASRLVSRAEPHQIIVSEAFRSALSNSEHLGLIGEAELKGRQNKLKIYSVRWNEITAHAGDCDIGQVSGQRA